MPVSNHSSRVQRAEKLSAGISFPGLPVPQSKCSASSWRVSAGAPARSRLVKYSAYHAPPAATGVASTPRPSPANTMVTAVTGCHIWSLILLTSTRIVSALLVREGVDGAVRGLQQALFLPANETREKLR
jgi:hypothetical protein